MNKKKDIIGLERKDIDSIINIIRKFSSRSKIFIFGSRAKGNFKTGSDIDLAIVDDTLTLDKILEIRLQLEELNLPYQFDILDYNKINNIDLKSHIDRVGIQLQ